jgi:glycosyltransferase involved in cell wall biosynthesis
MADAVEALLADPGRRARMGAAGRAYAERKVDREVVCRGIWDAVSAA